MHGHRSGSKAAGNEESAEGRNRGVRRTTELFLRKSRFGLGRAITRKIEGVEPKRLLIARRTWRAEGQETRVIIRS